MIHYTLNTGHSRFSPRDEVANDVIETVRPWTRNGRHPLPFGLWILQTGRLEAGLICTLWKRSEPVVTFAVAATAQYSEIMWSELESFYLKLTDSPGHRILDWSASRCPESAPWIAAVIVSPLASGEMWIADFERCLAWSFLEDLRCS